MSGDEPPDAPKPAHVAPGAASGPSPAPEFTVVWDGSRDAPAGPYLSADLEPPRRERDERPVVDRAVVLSVLRVQPMTIEELAIHLDLGVVKVQNVIYGLASAGEIVRIGYRRTVPRTFGQHRKGQAVYGVAERT